jgi:hypothetical protein
MTVYEGPSRLAPGMVQVKLSGLGGESSNRKTGKMVQSWILRSDMIPSEARKMGADKAICGSCPLRGNGCYVTMMGPNAVWKTKDTLTSEPPKLRYPLRIGAYGDPAAVPAEIWQNMLTPRWTGYTHFWRTNPELRSLCMASVETLTQAQEAWARGWRTYRILPKDGKLEKNEIWCPYYTRGTQCADCGLCNGASSSAKSIAIPPHGPLARGRKTA